MQRTATKPAKKTVPWIEVPRSEVIAIFKSNYPRGPLLDETHCYHLANAIDIVRNKALPPVKNDIPHYRDRRRVFDAISKLVAERIETYNQYPGYRPPAVISLEELRKSLKTAKDALLGVPNPLAGERKGAEWHWPAHYLAQFVDEALWLADRKKFQKKRASRDKGGRFVLVVRDTLELAGFNKFGAAAVAAVLQKATM